MIKRAFICATLFLTSTMSWGQNQTDTLSPVLSPVSLPFTIQIAQADFSLPSGIQSYASAIYDGKWVLLAGRTNGLHGFDNVGNNFPPSAQNTEVFVIDPATGTSWFRTLTTSTGLTQDQIDNLSVTASEFFQKGETLYLVGGYGINTSSGLMETKSTLTAIDLPKIIQWVIHGTSNVGSAVRQTSNPLLQVTGGALFQANDHEPMLLILGQNFAGLYTDSSNGQYTMQIRRFWINDDGKNLSILPASTTTTYSDYRRRDLNVAPILQNNRAAYVALSGVFTLDTGVWTVPISIAADGSSTEPSPTDPGTFKQGMNNYDCPSFGLYSTRLKEMFVVLPGGISFGYFSGDTFLTDAEIPFINQVTTVKIDKGNNFSQYLMEGEYPVILSTGSNPGNQLLFGAEAEFFPKDGIPLFNNGVVQFDALPAGSTVIGYIVGGIMSTLPNTNTSSDSTSSPYVFTVTVTK